MQITTKIKKCHSWFIVSNVFIIRLYIAAYDSYARLGLADSERIVCQITGDTFMAKKFDDRLLAVHNRTLD